MEITQNSVEPKNVSYERKKFRFQKKLKGLTFFTITLTLISATGFAFPKVEKLKSEIKIIAPILNVELHCLTDTAGAVFTNRTTLKLDVNKALSNFYLADITILKFSTLEECKSYFDSITDNLISHTIDFKAQTVLINVHLEYSKPEWKVIEWNNYINSKLNP